MAPLPEAKSLALASSGVAALYNWLQQTVMAFAEAGVITRTPVQQLGSA